jgi:hypothetical protein
MQGKFQLSLFHGVGHCLNEDDPIQVTKILNDFAARNSIGEPQKDSKPQRRVESQDSFRLASVRQAQQWHSAHPHHPARGMPLPKVPLFPRRGRRSSEDAGSGT